MAVLLLRSEIDPGSWASMFKGAKQICRVTRLIARGKRLAVGPTTREAESHKGQWDSASSDLRYLVS